MKLLIFVPFFLYACGSDTPAFVEKPEGIITLNVNHDGNGEEDDPTLEAGSDAEAIFSADFAEEPAAGSIDSADEASPEAGASIAAGGTPDDGSSEGPIDTSNTAIAKACGPYVKNQASKLKIIDGEQANLRLHIGADTALAIKLTGNQARLALDLPAGNDLPGICFFITGNQAQLTFTSAAAIAALAYIGRGHQSAGHIAFMAGSPLEAHVDLKGKHPTLTIQGLDPDLCAQERLPCSP